MQRARFTSIAKSCFVALIWACVRFAGNFDLLVAAMAMVPSVVAWQLGTDADNGSRRNLAKLLSSSAFSPSQQSTNNLKISDATVTVCTLAALVPKCVSLDYQQRRHRLSISARPRAEFKSCHFDLGVLFTNFSH